MDTKRFCVLLLCSTLASGCHMLDNQKSPDVMTAPPYWQSQSQITQDQLSEMRAFHEKESSRISEDIHVFRNREVERLAANSKEMESAKPRQAKTQNDSRTETPEQRDKWAWLNWFNKKNKPGA